MSYFNRMGFNKVIIKLLFFNNNDVNISSFFYFYFRNEFLNLFKSFHTLPQSQYESFARSLSTYHQLVVFDKNIIEVVNQINEKLNEEVK